MRDGELSMTAQTSEVPRGLGRLSHALDERARSKLAPWAFIIADSCLVHVVRAPPEQDAERKRAPWLQLGAEPI